MMKQMYPNIYLNFIPTRKVNPDTKLQILRISLALHSIRTVAWNPSVVAIDSL